MAKAALFVLNGDPMCFIRPWSVSGIGVLR